MYNIEDWVAFDVTCLWKHRTSKKEMEYLFNFDVFAYHLNRLPGQEVGRRHLWLRVKRHAQKHWRAACREDHVEGDFECLAVPFVPGPCEEHGALQTGDCHHEGHGPSQHHKAL